MRRRLGCACLVVLVSFVFPHTSAAATLACSSSSNAALLTGISNTTITSISVQFPGTAVACRVQATIRPLGPTGDSVIRMELWLPLPQFVGGPSPWNQKFLGIGNGGYAGSIPSVQLQQGARFGFATAGTDT